VKSGILKYTETFTKTQIKKSEKKSGNKIKIEHRRAICGVGR
jgi:hypothetical protein